MPSAEKLRTHQNALAVNLDPTSCCSFANIGAGQEIAHRLLVLGGSSETICPIDFCV